MIAIHLIKSNSVMSDWTEQAKWLIGLGSTAGGSAVLGLLYKLIELIINKKKENKTNKEIATELINKFSETISTPNNKKSNKKVKKSKKSI